MDVDQLLAGQRFDRELDKALAECQVLIAVIGARWMDLLSECAQHGNRDYLRDEIAAALQRDKIVIPVMVGREANMPPPLAKDLPENIRDLVLVFARISNLRTVSCDSYCCMLVLKRGRDARGSLGDGSIIWFRPASDCSIRF